MYGIAGEGTVALEVTPIDGEPGLDITGWEATHLPDALRAARRPLGRRMRIRVKPPPGGRAPTLDLAVALAVLIAHDGRSDLEIGGLVAAGSLGTDGHLGPALAHPALRLPSEPWVGRFWTPVSDPPRPSDDTLLTIFEVTSFAEAWDVLERLPELDRGVRALGG